ncbi:glycosyltransferase family 2 protein [Blastococcus saxobsidens]|nr:glycosyltransferase family 2 protein [Blastococcus saxobsidens]
MPGAEAVLGAAQAVVLVYFLVLNSCYAVQLVAATLETLQHTRTVRGADHRRLLGSGVAPRISILAPAHNEEATVSESVTSLLTLQYPNLEIVLVNDGSADGTLDVVTRAFGLTSIHPVYWRRIATKPVRGLYRSSTHPDLIVVDKENGGKADALNAALNVATGDLVCAIDADTLIESDALLRMVRPMLTDDTVLAAGGTIRVANGSLIRGGRVVTARAPRTFLAGVQAVEYLRAFLFGRLGWNRLGGNLIISGAFGLFRRDAVIAVGGYLHATVGEDMELVARIRRNAREQRLPDRVVFIPDPVAWTEVPESLAVLGRQRDRWHRGLADVLWRYRRQLLNPRYGALGMVVLPYFLLIELLAPVVEFLAIIGLVPALLFGAVDVRFAVLLFLVAYGYGLLLTVCTLLLDEVAYRRYHGLADRAVMVLWAVVESLGYRQLTVVWRLRGLWKYLRKRTDWGTMTRRGFAPSP